jgi:broad specificity phosphatase PhoE
MNDIQRIFFDVMRHAEPMKDPETKRSLDNLTWKGKEDAILEGKACANTDANSVHMYDSGMNRARQTIAGITIGMGTIADKYATSADLGLAVFKGEGRKLPSGIAYGPEFIDWIVANNPGIAEEIGTEMTNFVRAAYQEAAKAEQDTLVLAVSHGPKVEMGYGMLSGVPVEELGQYAANPLDGFQIEVDRHKKSGTIDECKVSYKGQEFEKLDSGLFAPKD